MSMSLQSVNGPLQQLSSLSNETASYSRFSCSDTTSVDRHSGSSIVKPSTALMTQPLVPKFTVLPKSSSKQPGPLSAPSLVIAQYGVNDMKQIAKEALRLSKETLLWHRSHPESTPGTAGKSLLQPLLAPNPNTMPTDPPALALPPRKASTSRSSSSTAGRSSPPSGGRLNKFVRRLYDMLEAESESGIVEWRRGLLILQNTSVFAKHTLPKYFNTRNFKTFRRQLNYYGFVHVRSFNNIHGASGAGSVTTASSTTASSTSALWVNRELVARCAASDETNDSIASVLLLKRVEPCEASKTVEGRRVRKELARSTVEDDLGVSAKSLWLPPEVRRACPERRPQVLLQHHNYNASTTIGASIERSPEIYVSDSVTMSDPSSDEETVSHQVHSSTSVANLLLLLSKN